MKNSLSRYRAGLFGGVVWALLLFVTSCEKGKDDPVPGVATGQWQKESLSGFPGSLYRYLPASFVGEDTLVYGLGDYFTVDQHAFNDIWLYTKGKWSKIEFPGMKRQVPITFLLNGKVYAGLGFYFMDELKDLWAYDLKTQTWDSLPFVFPGEGQRRGAVLFETGGKIYYGAGERQGKLYADMYRFDAENGWQEFFSERQVYSTIFTLNNEVYSCFGKDATGAYIRTIRKFNADNGQWETVCRFKPEDYPSVTRTEGKAFVIREAEGEFAYIIGGKPEAEEGDFWTCCRYDPRKNILEKVDAPLPVVELEVAFSMENNGYIFGDGKDMWRFIPE